MRPIFPQARQTLQARKNASLRGSTYVGPFDNWTVRHDFYGIVNDWLIMHLEEVTQPAIFVILGPAGIGKTTLILDLIHQLIAYKKAQMERDPSVIPYLLADACFTPGVGLDWRTMFADMLESGNDFLIDAKVASAADRPGTTLPALRRAVINMMLYREPALAMVDEASELTVKSSKSGLERNAHYLKALGNDSKTHMAFFGDYRLAGLADISGQLSRRIYWAHLPSYPVSHRASFEQVITAFEERGRKMGMDIELQSSADMLFAASCGCVGLLHRWLIEAAIEARVRKGGINHAILQATVFPDHDVALWRKEIADGNKTIEALRRRTGRVFTP